LYYVGEVVCERHPAYTRTTTNILNMNYQICGQVLTDLSQLLFHSFSLLKNISFEK